MKEHEEGRKLLGEEQWHHQHQLHLPKKDNQNQKQRLNMFRRATFGRATHMFSLSPWTGRPPSSM